MGIKGYVMNIQPFSVNDGDGIRTAVFLAGCPLRCKWCSNPEGFTAEPKVGWYESRCIGCGACEAVCPEGIGIDMNAKSAAVSPGSSDETLALDRTRCTACGKCVDLCPTEARSNMASLMDADEVLKQIQKHRIFYSYSGGGVTFSGGEATSQIEFLDYLSEQIYDMGFNMAIETCCMFDWEKASPILARMDQIFADLKLMDSERHREWTGVSNEKILENIVRLGSIAGLGNISKYASIAETEKGPNNQGPEIIIRIPVVGGVNDDEDNIRSSAGFVHKHLPHAKMELLPYHELGTIKYRALGIPYEQQGLYAPGKEDMNRLRAIVNEEGVALADFR